MPGRSTVFVRCAPRCIDAKFAGAVLSVYKSAERVPADPAVAGGVVESVRSALEGNVGGIGHLEGSGGGSTALQAYLVCQVDNQGVSDLHS